MAVAAPVAAASNPKPGFGAAEEISSSHSAGFSVKPLQIASNKLA